MSNPKFTKGPWRKAVGRTFCAIRTDYGLIADMRTVNGCFSSHNADLIAAAPDMYAMLNEIADATVHNFNYETAKPIYELLAKARGEND